MPAERERRTTDLGVEVKCAKCDEFWPEDDEFYFINKGRAHSWCKACYRSDPMVLAKVQRWTEKQRKNPPPPPKPACEWGPIMRAMYGSGAPAP